MTNSTGDNRGRSAAPIRSLHVGKSFDEEMGGSIRAALNVAKALCRAGDPAECIGSGGPEDALGYLGAEYPEVPVHLFERRLPRRYGRAPQARRWLDDNISGFDVVDLHGVFSFMAVYGARAAKRRGVPYIVRPHGSLQAYDLRKRTRRKALFGRLGLRAILEGAAAIVLTSELEAERLVTYGAEVQKVVIPLPVPSNPQRGDSGEFRTRHGIPQDALVVLFLGRIDPKKGLDLLVPAVAEARGRLANLHLVIVGDGDARDVADLDAAVVAQGSPPWIIRTGFLSGADKAAAYSAADMFALPSRNENFGIAVVEAMQAGIPVIVSTEVDIHHEISLARAGVVCEPTSQSCLESIVELGGDADRRKLMSEQAVVAADATFGERATVGRLQELYRTVSNGHGSHGNARAGTRLAVL